LAHMLHGGPMNAIELLVALHDARYRTTRTPKALQGALPVELKKDRRFEVRGDKWHMS